MGSACCRPSIRCSFEAASRGGGKAFGGARARCVFAAFLGRHADHQGAGGDDHVPPVAGVDVGLHGGGDGGAPGRVEGQVEHDRDGGAGGDDVAQVHRQGRGAFAPVDADRLVVVVEELERVGASRVSAPGPRPG